MEFNNTYNLLEAYETLGIQPNASLKDARKAYFKLSLQYHPDKCKGGEKEKFQKISNAYQTISGHLEKKGKCDQHKQSILDLVAKYHDLADLGFLYTVPDEVLEEIPDSWIANLNYFHDLFTKEYRCQPRRPFFSTTFTTQKQKVEPDLGETTDIDVSVSFEDAYIGDVKKIAVDVYDEDDLPCSVEVSILPCEGTYTFPERGDVSDTDGKKRLPLCVHVTIRPHDFFYLFLKENNYDCECDLHLTLKDVVTGGNKYILMPDGRYVHICVKPNFLVRFLNGSRFLSIPQYGFLNQSCVERGNLIVHFAIDLPPASVDLSCLGTNLEESHTHDKCFTFSV